MTFLMSYGLGDTRSHLLALNLLTFSFLCGCELQPFSISMEVNHGVQRSAEEDAETTEPEKLERRSENSQTQLQDDPSGIRPEAVDIWPATVPSKDIEGQTVR